MSFSRRHFLRSLLALPIAATLDVEKLLWVPGQMIVVPGLPPVLALEEINEVVLRNVMPGIQTDFFRNGPFLAYLQARSMVAIPSVDLIYQRRS